MTDEKLLAFVLICCVLVGLYWWFEVHSTREQTCEKCGAQRTYSSPTVTGSPDLPRFANSGMGLHRVWPLEWWRWLNTVCGSIRVPGRVETQACSTTPVNAKKGLTPPISIQAAIPENFSVQPRHVGMIRDIMAFAAHPAPGWTSGHTKAVRRTTRRERQ